VARYSALVARPGWRACQPSHGLGPVRPGFADLGSRASTLRPGSFSIQESRLCVFKPSSSLSRANGHGLGGDDWLPVDLCVPAGCGLAKWVCQQVPAVVPGGPLRPRWPDALFESLALASACARRGGCPGFARHGPGASWRARLASRRPVSGPGPDRAHRAIGSRRGRGQRSRPAMTCRRQPHCSPLGHARRVRTPLRRCARLRP